MGQRKQQLMRAGSFLQGEGALSSSEPGISQRGAEHSGHHPWECRQQCINKGPNEEQNGVIIHPGAAALPKRATAEEHRWEHVSAPTHPCNCGMCAQGTLPCLGLLS